MSKNQHVDFSTCRFFIDEFSKGQMSIFRCRFWVTKIDMSILSARSETKGKMLIFRMSIFRHVDFRHVDFSSMNSLSARCRFSDVDFRPPKSTSVETNAGAACESAVMHHSESQVKNRHVDFFCRMSIFFLSECRFLVSRFA